MKNAHSITSAVTVRIRRIANRRRTSEPFLSGDFFASLADTVIEKLPLESSTLEKLQKSEVVFVKSNLLEEFLLKYSSAISSRVIICGNSDYDFTQALEIPKSVKRMYLQNSFITNNKDFFTLPIGIENLRISINGLPRLMKPGLPWNKRKKKVLVGPFSSTHPERESLEKSIQLLVSQEIEIVKHRLSPKDYSALMQQYQYVFCPRGNGVDTHRFWEALYRGAVPIVIESQWSRGIRHLKIPFIEITEPTETAILRGIRDFSGEVAEPSKYPTLWSDYWKREILFT